MAKVKTTFFCQSCGSQYAKWQGQCTSCKAWNTIVEEVIQKPEKNDWKASTSSVKRASVPLQIKDINLSKEPRLDTFDAEFNRVLGGGIVPGSLTLLGGEPGIGKSTLLLQISLKLPYKTLYVSGEESQKQIKMRAERINPEHNNCYILTETKTQNIFKQIEVLEPDIVIIDSIQTLHSDYIESSSGSISQIKECTTELIKFAKETTTPVLLIGHITKDGHIAGPKILEHMVDTVLQFEGDRNHVFRILRANKNRFGSTNELGIYEMQGSGLREVSNPSEILISKKDEELSGNAIAATLEGMRPLMIEVQALVSTAVYGTPQRSATGFNAKRLNMLLAVLEKRAGFRLGAKDVFLSEILLYLDRKIVENPNFSASNIRCSTRCIGLISPDKPTSAAKQKSFCSETSSLEDKIDATTAKSMAGSSTLIPPVIFKNTSFAPNLNPARFSKTARIIFKRFKL